MLLLPSRFFHYPIHPRILSASFAPSATRQGTRYSEISDQVIRELVAPASHGRLQRGAGRHPARRPRRIRPRHRRRAEPPLGEPGDGLEERVDLLRLPPGRVHGDGRRRARPAPRGPAGGRRRQPLLLLRRRAPPRRRPRLRPHALPLLLVDISHRGGVLAGWAVAVRLPHRLPHSDIRKPTGLRDSAAGHIRSRCGFCPDHRCAHWVLLLLLLQVTGVLPTSGGRHWHEPF